MSKLFDFPVAEFCRLCQRVRDGELDVLNRESRELITPILYAAAEHLVDGLSAEGMSEVLRQGAQEKPDPHVKVPAYQRLTEGWDPDELKGGK